MKWYEQTHGRIKRRVHDIPHESTPHVRSLRASSHAVERAGERLDILLHDMGIDFGGLHVGMAHQFLNYTDVHAVFKQVGNSA